MSATAPLPHDAAPADRSARELGNPGHQDFPVCQRLPHRGQEVVSWTDLLTEFEGPASPVTALAVREALTDTQRLIDELDSSA
jgi:hypothetical protein